MLSDLQSEEGQDQAPSPVRGGVEDDSEARGSGPEGLGGW